MNSIYKNPYKKKYKLEIIDKINRDGITYGKIENPPFFLGSERLSKDEIKINGEDPVFLSGNKKYFKIDENTKSVEIEIAWKNRLLLMQENLGNALVRHFLLSNTNIEILNYRVENNSSYIDVSSKDFKFMTAKNIESLANYAVFSNLQIENFGDHISIERLADIDYEGPSLSRTGEIGMLFISSIDRIDSNIRLTIKSGENAYKLARNSLNILDNMKMYLNSDSIESVFSDVKKLKSNITSSRFSPENNIKNKDSVEANKSKEDASPINVEKNLEKNSKIEKSFDSKRASEDKNKENLSLTSKDVIDNKSKEKYDVKKCHELYKLESFKDLNKKMPGQKDFKSEISKKDKFSLDSNNEKNKLMDKEKYDSKKYHKLYKLESFKDLNKKIISSEADKSKDTKVKEDNQIEKISNSKDKNQEEEEKSPLFYQAVESFMAFSTEVSGLNYIYKILHEVNLNELREISNYILKEKDFIQIYGLKNGSKSKILILRSQNLNFDLKKIFEKLKEHFSFTGTGNMYTLDINCQEKDLKRIMESFLIEIKREAK